jgi:hypothetical protein
MSIFDKIFGGHTSGDGQGPSSSAGIFEKFISTYKPSDNLIKPKREMVEWYADKLPKVLIDFWQQYGFGNYGDGLIKVVEPSEYMDSFYTWTGKQDFSKLPILMTAFGDIFYYRKLSETEEDVCLLDIHYRNIEVCEYSLAGFFEKYIIDAGIAEELIRKPLFEQAVNKLGKLQAREIYYFVPALVTGGAEDIKYIDKGAASVHQSVLHSMGA